MMLMMLGCSPAVFASGTVDIVADGTKTNQQDQNESQTTTVTTVQNVVTGYSETAWLYVLTLAAGAGALCLLTHVRLDRVRNGQR